MRYWHKELARGRWQGLPLDEQMGNVASEVRRVWSRRKAGDERASKMAFRRALELIDLSLASEWPVHRLGEMARLREVFCDTYLEAGEYDVTPEMIDDYLLWFAIKARAGK